MHTRHVKLLLAVLLGASGLVILFHLLLDLGAGGNPWKQGDWLINRETVDIRRGYFGSLILAVADGTGLGPLATVALLQAVAALALLVLLARVLLLAPVPAVALLLLASPALAPFFWAADPQGGLRKEILAFIAVLLAVEGLVRDRFAAFLAGTALLSLAVFAHEANILFLPLFAGLALWGSRGRADRPAYLAATGIATAITAVALVHAVAHRALPDPALVCDPLLQRGLSAEICGGAIGYLSNDSLDALKQVYFTFGAGRIALFLGLYLLAAAPLLYLVSRLDRPGRAFLLAVALALPFLPLYVLSVDWGRWMSLHVFSVVVTLAFLLRQGDLALARPVQLRVAAAFLVLGLLWAPTHFVGFVPGGMLASLVSAPDAASLR